MAKGIIWKKNDLVSLKLRDDLFTIAQMLTSPAMRFYKIKSLDGNWKGVDLNHIEPLFQVFVGKVVLQDLADRKIKDVSVKASGALYERFWIKPHLNYDGGFPFKGGKLIDLGPEGGIGTAVAPVIRQDLSVEQDRDAIKKYQLTNMWGADDLGDRLRHFFDTGEDRDPLKAKVFPQLLVP
jgi:hypothetical protein